MLAIFSLHEDGDGYLQYRIVRIFGVDLTLSELGQVYPDKILFFKGKGYLGDQVVATYPNLKSFCPRLLLDDTCVDMVKSAGIKCRRCYGEYYDGDVIPYGVDVKEIYYVCQTDGKYFDINTLV